MIMFLLILQVLLVIFYLYFIACASLLCDGKYQYGINWSGGLHHAKQS